MHLTLNGQAYETTQNTLADLLLELKLDDAVVATAVNGVFITRSRRSSIQLHAGDSVEALSPMQGG